MILSKEQRWKILLEMKEILDSLNIPFFLTCGTALGAVREPDGFIERDSDVDLGILENYENRIPEIIKKGEEKGWEVGIWYDPTLNGKGKIISFFKDGYELVDIGVYYREGEYYWHCINFGDCVQEFVPIFEFGKIKIRNVEFNIPSPSEKYLEAIYGKNWRIPVSFEDYMANLAGRRKRY